MSFSFASILRPGITIAVIACAIIGAADALPATPAAVPDARTASIETSSWTTCALEGGTCRFPGSRRVRYGTDTRYVERIFSDRVSCTASAFDDPSAGTAKVCRYSAAVEPGPDDVWVMCASEQQHCPFSGTRIVRYGLPGRYVSGVFDEGVACSAAVFGDPVAGSSKRCSYAKTPLRDDLASRRPGPSGSTPPIVLNVSRPGGGGDVVTLQGDRFGDRPRVFFDAKPDVALEVVNQIDARWMAVQLPADAPTPLAIRISNATGTSATILLDAARPMHLDTTTLVAGGPFRLFGRSLMSAGSTPRITIDGVPAQLDLARSDAYRLVAIAPAALVAHDAATIVVDNGNGSGPVGLDVKPRVTRSGVGDPQALGVGWGADFAGISAFTVDAARDPRLPLHVLCDALHDDAPALRAAIDFAAARGGGVVRLPAGSCRIGAPFPLRSHVIVLGAGKDATEIVHGSDFVFTGDGIDLAGLGDFTLTNLGGASEGPMLRNSTRIFLRDMRLQLGRSRQAFFTDNRLFVVRNTEFIQTGSIQEQGPYLFSGCSGLVFEGNTTHWMNGAPTFARVSDSYLHDNRFSRDATKESESGVVHGMVLDFAHRIDVVGNVFDVVGGPLTRGDRNDGETILSEGGGANRTETAGTVATATANTLTDPATRFRVDPFGTGTLPENYGVAIVAGTGTGQTRHVVAANGPTLTVDRPWDIVPDATSHYAAFVWGLERALIKDNVLAGNPRGIWLYQTAVRDVDIVGNRIVEGGGIFLRANQNLSVHGFVPIWNVVIADNAITNTTGRWLSYIDVVFANIGARAFGVAVLGIDVRGNRLVANRPNVSTRLEDLAGAEGYTNLMRVERDAGDDLSLQPSLLGTVFADNDCAHCDVAFRIGTGAAGTTVLRNRVFQSPTFLTNESTTVLPVRATATIVR